MFLLHGLKKPDIVFFVICAIIIVAIIAIYFLIPVIKRKEYSQRRENLKRREILFRENQKEEKPLVVEVVTPAEDKEAVAAVEPQEVD